MTRERRDPANQQPRTGGRRQDDPPYTVRECATWMGVTSDYILGAIHEGVWSRRDQRLVHLQAEYLPGREAHGRGEYRIYSDCFLAFLRAIGWSRLPAR